MAALRSNPDRPGKFALPDANGKMQVVSFDEWSNARPNIVQVVKGTRVWNPALSRKKRLISSWSD